jgi:hypothetical protein
MPRAARSSVSRRRFLLTAFAAALPQPASAAARPLWEGARYTIAQRDRAIRRGLSFIYRLSRNGGTFAENGDDLLWCFYTLAATAADPWLRQNAQKMGQERARQWRRENPAIPARATADDIASLVFGNLAADALGVREAAMKPLLAKAAERFSAVDYLKFDPKTGMIPQDIPQACEGDEERNSRAGSKRCAAFASPYDLLIDALTTTYSGDRYGVRLGASLPEVMALVPRMRPYRVTGEGDDSNFIDLTYAVTHVVYALNDYGKYRLRPEWLPQEYAYLRENLERSIKDDDPETTGEFVDTLKSFGLTGQDPLIRKGVEFIMRTQHADGSWGDRSDNDPYVAYHSTWTAINGLMDYAWAGEGVSFPEALRRAREG